MDDQRNRKILVGALIAAIDAAYLWLALPFTAAVFRAAPLAAASARDVPLATAYIKDYIDNSLFSGWSQVSAPFAPETWFGWIVFAAMNIAFVWPILKRATGRTASSNPVLDAQPDPVGGNIYGDARFLRTFSDFKTEAQFTYRENKDLENSMGGLYLGTDGKRVYMVEEDAHVLVLAPTRVGKTRRVILNMIALLGMSDESMIVLDVKGELFGLCAQFLRERGFRVNRVDYSDPTKGNYYNPLYRAVDAYERMHEAYRQRETLRHELGHAATEHQEFAKFDGAYRDAIQDAESAVNELVAIIMPRDLDREGDSKFWNDGAWNALKKGLHYAASNQSIPREQRNIQTALMLLQDYDRPCPLFPDDPKARETFVPLDEMISQLPPEHPAHKALKALGRAKQEYMSSFIQSATSALASYTSYAVSQMMLGTDIPIEDLCEEKTATFIIVPENKEEFKSLAQLYINQAYSLLVDQSQRNGNRLPRRMNIIGEEWGQVPRVDALDERLSISAGRGIRWVLVLQNLAKLEEKYDRAPAKVIIDNCAYTVILACDEDQTAEAFSKGFGEYSTHYEEHSSSKRGFALFSDSFSDSGRTVKRPLLMAQELKLWRPEYGAIVTARSQRPAIVPVPIANDTYLGQLLGLGTPEQEQERIARERASAVHPEVYDQPLWRPEYGSKPKNESDVAARTRYTKWLKSMAASARNRRGIKPENASGEAGGQTKPAKAPAPKVTTARAERARNKRKARTPLEGQQAFDFGGASARAPDSNSLPPQDC